MRNLGLIALLGVACFAADSPDGTTPLHLAVHANDLAAVNKLLAAGADAKSANRYGITPLYLACENANPAIIERLLKAGADANAVSTEGETALMTVARTGVVEAARVLLDHGANVDAREEWHGQTALMWAVNEQHPAMVKELIAHGADVNAVSNINKWERQNTSEPREKWLPSGGLTPLLFAARQGCVECERILLDAGARINTTDPDGVSPVLIAIINGHYDAAGFLLNRGADPNLADETGRTALFAAVDFNTVPVSNRPAPRVIDNQISSLDLIKLLLDKGANVNAQLKKQQPYRAKLDRGQDTMLTTGSTPLLRAAKAADLPAMRLLLAKGADAKLATRAGINPLMAAAGLGSKEEDATGRFKTEADAVEAIQLCLDAGVDINAANGQGQTALHAAALKGYDKVVQFLADRGANLNAKDRQGKTPLDAALGLAGGSGGFDGSRRDVHESTAELLKKLMAKAQ
ncbi:MAG TPA: ankyrin repeat domain-containing protein [Bryobacteraceae bacterium]|nr:ankyrin repeat domain-containing protein [Bryobacteraceae bacterium]